MTYLKPTGLNPIRQRRGNSSGWLNYDTAVAQLDLAIGVQVQF